ncbi:MAG TPA: hypothetical protein VF885_15235 [Arthrobacter sp.]
MIEQTAAQKHAVITLIDGLHATNIVVGEARDIPGAIVATFEDASSRRNYGSAAVVTIAADGEVPRVQLRHVIEAGSGGFDTTDETEKPYGAKVRGILAAAHA